MNPGPLPLGPLQLAVAASLVGVNGLLSWRLGLELERKLAIASLRTVVQLLLLGLILEPVFAWRRPDLILVLGALMIALAARAAVGRSSRAYAGLTSHTFVALVVGAGATALLGSAVVIGVEPWWEPRYLIPLLGMVLGNSLTGISLGIDRALSQLDEGQDRVEWALSMGASRWETARPVAAEALRTGMIPIINAMTVVGLVTIPGMMTGQILGGVDPSLAARYQIMIMFLIAGATALGAVGAILASLASLFDAEHRLRLERLVRRPS